MEEQEGNGLVSISKSNTLSHKIKKQLNLFKRYGWRLGYIRKFITPLFVKEFEESNIHDMINLSIDFTKIIHI